MFVYHFFSESLFTNSRFVLGAQTGPKFCVANLRAEDDFSMLSFLHLILSINFFLLLITTIKINWFFQSLNSFWYYIMLPSFFNIDRNVNKNTSCNNEIQCIYSWHNISNRMLELLYPLIVRVHCKTIWLDLWAELGWEAPYNKDIKLKVIAFSDNYFLNWKKT